MTEVIAAPDTRKRRGSTQRIKRHSSVGMKIDMTPMVDLGFLLISFFIFTTQISKPVVTKLNMPLNGDSSLVANSKTLTFLLGGRNQLFYYAGNFESAAQNNLVLRTTYDEKSGIGNIIRKKQTELKNQHTDPHQLFIIIKPMNQCPYGRIIDVVDEMLINNVTRYTLADSQKQEEIFAEGNH